MRHDRHGCYTERHRVAWQDGGRRKLLSKFHKSLDEMTAVIKEIHKYASGAKLKDWETADKLINELDDLTKKYKQVNK